jgi:hypothetical protein
MPTTLDGPLIVYPFKFTVTSAAPMVSTLPDACARQSRLRVRVTLEVSTEPQVIEAALAKRGTIHAPTTTNDDPTIT